MRLFLPPALHAQMRYLRVRRVYSDSLDLINEEEQNRSPYRATIEIDCSRQRLQKQFSYRLHDYSSDTIRQEQEDFVPPYIKYSKASPCYLGLRAKIMREFLFL